MCDMMWFCDVVQCQVWNVVLQCGMMVWCMGNVVVCCDSRCEMWSVVEYRVMWNGLTPYSDLVWWGMMVEMQCGMCGVVWNVCCGTVRYIIYIWMWWCTWCGVRWNVGVMWNGVLRCGMSVAWMDYRMRSGGERCAEEERMVWNGGVKLPWCDYGMDKVMCSVQSSLLFLHYAVFSVMSVHYCLCVSRTQCTQCSVSVYSVGSVL